MVHANKYIHEEMMEYYLPHFGKQCPDGWLANNTNCAVFELTYDQAVSCLNMLNPQTRYKPKDQERNIIEEYYAHYQEESTYAAQLQIQYERCCRNLIETYLNANAESTSKTLHQHIDKQQATISELENENRKLKKALDLATQSPDYAKIKQQICTEYATKYTFLEDEALRSLIEGELIYKTLKDSGSCYDSMVMLYARVVEAQLKKHLKDKCPEAVRDHMTLGAVILEISERYISPYHKSVNIYLEINHCRNIAAHPEDHPDKTTDSIVLDTVEKLRKMLFEEKVLERLRQGVGESRLRLPVVYFAPRLEKLMPGISSTILLFCSCASSILLTSRSRSLISWLSFM